MADSIGSLVVRLGLNHAEFTSGLTRAEFQAQRFARQTRAAILEVGKVLGGLAIGNEILQATKAIIGEAAALNDLSDATGSSVEALSRLNNQAKIAGTDFAAMQTALLKLSQGMANVDDESKDATRALQFLGITTKDPAEALQQIAQKLTGFQDGLGKVALATALFGKTGASLLPTLKDIAELSDVGATVTKRQAEEAEALEKAYRRLTVEATQFKDAILSGVVPALLQALEDMREGTKIAGGFLNAILQFGTLSPFDTPAAGIAKLRGEIEDLKRQKLEGKDLFGDLGPEIKLRENQLNFLLHKQRQAALALIDPSNNDRLDRLAQRRPEATFTLKNDKAAKTTREVTSEVQRYIEALERQLDRTEELTVVEQILRDVQLGRVKGLAGPQLDQALRIGQQIDELKALKKAEDEAKKAAEEDAKARERMAEAINRSIEAERREAESLAQSNEQLVEQLIHIRGGEDALLAYTQAKLAKAAAERDDFAATLASVGANEEVVRAIRDQAAALRERGRLIGEIDIAKKFAEEMRAMQDVRNLFADSFADQFAQVIDGTKSAKEAFRDFAADVVRQINRIAAQNVANAIFGGNTGGSADFFGILAKLIGAGIGAGTGGSAPFMGGGGIPAPFAAGGFPQPGLALVGERGPELVTMRGNERVYNARDTAAMLGRPTINQTVNVMVQGAVSRGTAEQIGRSISQHTADVMRR